MITKELIEDAKAAGIQVPRIKVTDPMNRFGSHVGGFNYDYEFLSRLAKLVELQRQRERQAVPSGQKPIGHVHVGCNDWGPFEFEPTPYGYDHLPDGKHKLYTESVIADLCKKLEEHLVFLERVIHKPNYVDSSGDADQIRRLIEPQISRMRQAISNNGDCPHPIVEELTKE
jgi:hypothetical protein